MTDFHARQGIVAPHPHPRRPETPSLINTGCEGSAVQLLRRLVVVRVTETMGVRMLFTLVLVSGVICGTCGKIFSEKGVEVRVMIFFFLAGNRQSVTVLFRSEREVKLGFLFTGDVDASL